MPIWKGDSYETTIFGDTLSGHNFLCQGATPLGNWKIDSMSRSGNFMKGMVDFQCRLIYQKVNRAVVIPKRMHQKPNRCLSQSSVMGARTKFRITTQKPDVRITLHPYEMKCTEGTHGFFVECNPSRNLRITRQQRTRGECSIYVHSSTKV